MEPEKTTEQIGAALATVRANLSQRQQELAAAERKVSEIDDQYDAQSIAWLNFHDRDAKNWLDSSDKELYMARSEVRQLAAATRGLNERVLELEAELSAAKRHDVELELAKEELAVSSTALMTDENIGGLQLSINEILSRQERMVMLANSIGKSPTRYEKIADHLRRAVVHQPFPRTGGWLNKEARVTYSQPVSKILENLLRGDESSWIDVTEEVLKTDAREAS
jgi:chromosome segregation ATPase